MPQYLSPGVFVEEVTSGSSPVTGVSTTTAAFVGSVLDGVDMGPIPGGGEGETYELTPAGEPQAVTNWEEFKAAFGDFHANNITLAQAVFGFFNNGGTRCWIVRVNSAISDESYGQDVQLALAELTAIDEISLVSVPGSVDAAVQLALIDHCENAGDRFALLEGQQDPGALTSSDIKGTVKNSSFAAMYFPWIEVFNPLDPETKAFVGPSGHIAGLIARVDGARGVHKAPANETIRGALSVQQRLSSNHQDVLNPDGINVIRNFNSNITVWGARTLGGDENNEWKYINIRRLFLFLSESIEDGTRWTVFEPNTQDLWAKITRNLNAFLTNVWRSGALFGNTPEEAFFIKCDQENNPPSVRDAGQVIIEIGIAPAKPAEFVVFRISQSSGFNG